MEWQRIAGGDCNRNDCPTVFITGEGRLAIQGYIVDRQAPDGEGIVEIPMEVLREAVRALGW